MSIYQLMISDFHNIPIRNVKKFVSNVFDKGNYVLYHENLQLYLRVRIKLKKKHRVLEFNQSQ